MWNLQDDRIRVYDSEIPILGHRRWWLSGNSAEVLTFKLAQADQINRRGNPKAIFAGKTNRTFYIYRSEPCWFIRLRSWCWYFINLIGLTFTGAASFIERKHRLPQNELLFYVTTGITGSNSPKETTLWHEFNPSKHSKSRSKKDSLDRSPCPWWPSRASRTSFLEINIRKIPFSSPYAKRFGTTK